MEIWIIVLLAIVSASALTALGIIKYNLHSAYRLLDHIDEKSPQQNLRLKTPQRDVEKLLVKVNQLLDQMRRQEIQHGKLQNQLREEIANISHDLRTPLTSILGYLQLLESDACTPQERKQYLTIIQKRAQSLQTLIGGFYDLSRLELGSYHFEWEEVSLEKTLFDLAATFYYDFMEKQMEPVLEVQKGLPMVWADRDVVYRIYANLISNALKHGKGKLYISAVYQGEEIITCFRNNAPDLSQQDVERLFERFYTADKMRTGQNTGLGLAIVAQLVEQMGAHVFAQKKGSLLEIRVVWQPCRETTGRKPNSYRH